MEKVTLDSVGMKGEIETTPTKIMDILSDPFTFHYIPNCMLSSGCGEVFVREEVSQQSPAEVDYPEVRLSPIADNRSFVVMCEYLMERARQDKLGIYSISSSAAYKDDNGVVFFGGATNLGKSSCTLELALNGFNLFSDEKTLLDLKEKKMCGGSRSIILKKEIIKKRFDVSGVYKEIKCDYSVIPKARMVILPHLDHGLDEPIITKFEPLDLFWHLTKEFSRRIRGDTKFINYFEYLLPSLDTDELAQKRIALTREFAREVEGYYFQGNLGQLVDFLKSEF